VGNRLTNKNWTIREVLYISNQLYGSKVDNKARREAVDVVGGRVTMKKNLKWNPTTKSFEQSGRDVKIVFKVKSNPVSYTRTDTVKNHYYPVTFLIHDWSLGFDSSFRWRTGSNFKWKKSTRKISEGKTPEAKDRIRAENLKITNLNIRRGIQAQFLFNLQWVCKKEGVLFGPMTCLNQAPKETNPKFLLYFDKTALHCVLYLLPKLFENGNLRKFVSKEDFI
jgi:hypothetical protein